MFNWRKSKSDSIKTTKTSNDKHKSSPPKQKANATWSEAGSWSAGHRIAKNQKTNNSESHKQGRNESNDKSNRKTDNSNNASKKIAKQKPDESNSGSGVSGSLGSFEKFNHVRYRRKIKNKAIDIVNKHKKCSLARLCKDFYTEQWSLRIYIKKSKTYSFVSYAWDPISEKWNKDFKSPSRSNSTLKRNLKSSAAGKECKFVKGRIDHD